MVESQTDAEEIEIGMSLAADSFYLQLTEDIHADLQRVRWYSYLQQTGEGE